MQRYGNQSLTCMIARSGSSSELGPKKPKLSKRREGQGPGKGGSSGQGKGKGIKGGADAPTPGNDPPGSAKEGGKGSSS